MRHRQARHDRHGAKELEMWLAVDTTSGGWIFLWSVIYLALIVTLGVMSIRKGHWVMFIVGFFLPIFWLIGALMPTRRMR